MLEFALTVIYYSFGNIELIRQADRKGVDFMSRELVFRFHDPNTEKDTYNALVKIFTEVGCKKLKDAITDMESDNRQDKLIKAE